MEYSAWSNHIYPCSECDFVGELDAFSGGQCYNPCPKCGGKRKSRTGRFRYRLATERKKFLGLFPHTRQRLIFDGVEWR